MRTLVTLSSGGFKPSCCCCWSSNNFFFLACFSRRATAWTPDAMVPSRLFGWCPVSQPLTSFGSRKTSQTHFWAHRFYTLLQAAERTRITTTHTTSRTALGCGHLVSWIRTAGIDPCARHCGTTQWKRREIKGGSIAHCDEFSAGRFHSASQCQPKITLPREYIQYIIVNRACDLLKRWLINHLACFLKMERLVVM